MQTVLGWNMAALGHDCITPTSISSCWAFTCALPPCGCSTAQLKHVKHLLPTERCLTHPKNSARAASSFFSVVRYLQWINTSGRKRGEELLSAEGHQQTHQERTFLLQDLVHSPELLALPQSVNVLQLFVETLLWKVGCKFHLKSSLPMPAHAPVLGGEI